VESGGIIQRDLLVAAAVAMPVCDQVVGNAIQPGREGHASVGITLNMAHGAIENTGGQVLGVVHVACTIIYVVKYSFHVLLVQCAESLLVALRGARQEILIVKFRQLAHLTGGVLHTITPPGFRGFVGLSRLVREEPEHKIDKGYESKRGIIKILFPFVYLESFVFKSFYFYKTLVLFPDKVYHIRIVL
jgi:hypothetical protein